PRRPVGLYEGCGQQVLAVGAIEDEEVSVAAGLSDELTLLAFEFGVEKDGRLDGVPVVRVVRRGLEIPGKFAGVDVQGDDRFGVEIGAGTAATCEHGLRIAGA